MCEVLNLNYNIFAKRNHKGLSVEHFHRFLNKSVTIATEERGTNDIFFLLVLQVLMSGTVRPLIVLVLFVVFLLSIEH